MVTSEASPEPNAAEEAAEAEGAAQAEEEAAAERKAEAQAQEQSQSAQQGQPAQQQSSNSGGANSSVVRAAYSAVGSPYQWGGTSPAGFDCSGLINWAYDQAGQGGLPRMTHGMAVSLVQVCSPQPGDIVLANGDAHGAIYIGNDQVISATSSGGVRVHGLHEGWHQVTSYHSPA